MLLYVWLVGMHISQSELSQKHWILPVAKVTVISLVDSCIDTVLDSTVMFSHTPQSLGGGLLQWHLSQAAALRAAEAVRCV